MSWPATPMILTVQLELGGVWTDITSYVRTSEDIVITRGRPGPLGTTVPASCTLLLDNRDGRFSLNNPAGPYAGHLTRTTRLRVRINTGSGTITRFVGEVPDWPTRRSTAGRNQWSPLTAYGVTHRLAKGGRNRQSPLYRYTTAVSGLLAYWPLEDGSGATAATSAVAGVPPMEIVGSPRFGQTPPPGGVSSLMFPAGGFLVGRLKVAGGTSWRVECVVSYAAVPVGGRRILSWLSTGSATAWNLECLAAGFRLRGFSESATTSTLVQEIATTTLPEAGVLHHLRVDTEVVAGDMVTTLYLDGVQIGTDTLTGGSCSPPTYIRVNPDSNDDEENTPSSGHVAIWAPIPASSSTAEAATGWDGQEAHQRIEGVCATAGVDYWPVLGDTVDSEPMGPQPTGSIMQILRDAESTDAGLLFEAMTGEVSYRRREDLLNQDVKLALDYSQREVAPPFEPTSDDALLANSVTARRAGGAEATVTDDEHVALEGLHEGQVDVTPASDLRLPDLASWAVRRGTVRGDRWDALSLNLAHPAGAPLVPWWLDMELGDRISVTGIPDELSPDDADLMLVGYRETIRYPRTWRVEMVCEPYAPYVVGVRDTDRRDTAGSELASSVTSSATSLSVATTLGPVWTQSASDLPFDIRVGVGERMTVTAVSGSTSPQTFTVTRAVNGVAIAHAAGADVRLWTPAYRSL